MLLTPSVRSQGQRSRRIRRTVALSSPRNTVRAVEHAIERRDGCVSVLAAGSHRASVDRVNGLLRGAVSLAVLGLLSGCAADNTPVVPSDTGSPASVPSPSPTFDPIADLTLAQRVGQLFMVGTTASAPGQVTLDAISQRHVGSVFLSGRSTAGVPATAAVVSTFTSLVNQSTTGGQPLLVATDQEGGYVQVLQGTGFSRIPSGLEQGEMPTGQLQTSAQAWGAQLRAAGVNMNLAPVVDLVDSARAAAANPPIGVFHREFGFDVATIESHADAFRAGMSSSGVATVIKHFPGLGDVSANTDTSTGVTDTRIGPDDPSVAIYRSEIAAGARCIMVSSAVYTRIDGSAPAIFSPTVVGSLLRDQLGFRGLVMSDDLSAARQVAAWSPADRAILAIQAGADIVLVSADPTVAPQMVDAVLAKAQSDAAFAKLVDSAARRVVALKSELD
jgi:beta-N-acetylhexosaminidase